MENLLGISGSFDGFKSAEIFPLFFFESEEYDVALFLLTDDCIFELC